MVAHVSCWVDGGKEVRQRSRPSHPVLFRGNRMLQKRERPPQLRAQSLDVGRAHVEPVVHVWSHTKKPMYHFKWLTHGKKYISFGKIKFTAAVSLSGLQHWYEHNTGVETSDRVKEESTEWTCMIKTPTRDGGHTLGGWQAAAIQATLWIGLSPFGMSWRNTLSMR